MNELQRQAYLEAMGVVSYFPRAELPGALPSPILEMPVAEEVVHTPVQPEAAVAPVVNATPAGQVQSAKAIFEQTGEAVVDQLARRREVRPKRSGPVASASDIPSFALTIAKTQAGFLIVDEGLKPDQDYTEYLRLLQNMLFAVGAGMQAVQLDSFTWPMINNPQIDQSAEIAGQTLTVYIDKLIKEQRVSYVLVMGETAAKYMPANLSVFSLSTSSALQMLADPQLKAGAWQDLQLLKQALAAAS
jgi:hypothetical protein